MPHIGFFGGVPEISFNCKSRKEAKKMMKDYNQKSIWDAKKSREIDNKDYNPKTNPTEV